jgi:DMSO/TMAO reductase YedYZ heme-binding membrane subunit
VWLYFFRPEGGWIPRTDAFGLANHAGLGAVALLLTLLALSSDRSLGALGAARWKALHRAATYPTFLLVAGHAGLYQAVGRRTLALVLLFAAVALAVTGLQLAGYRSRRGASGTAAGG